MTDNLTQATDESPTANGRQTGDTKILLWTRLNQLLDKFRTVYPLTHVPVVATVPQALALTDKHHKDEYLWMKRLHHLQRNKRLEYDPLLTSTRLSEPLYSPTMPAFSPEHTCTYRPIKIFKSLDGATFPPRPVHILTNPGKDRYAYLAHDPRTVFAGAPSSFLIILRRTLCFTPEEESPLDRREAGRHIVLHWRTYFD